MNMLMPGLRMIALCLLAALAARADESAHLSKDQILSLVSALKWQTGTITLKDGLATINLGDDFRFLGNDDARKVLHDVWDNPDDPNILGMIFPKDIGPIDRDNWAVLVSYEDSGYVKDDDAGKINYDDLLKKMQDAAKAADAERVKEGYPTLDIVGWAEPPRYDPATHKLYWAKELKIGGEPEDGLNYDIRILGRRGVLVLSVLGGMSQLQQINDAAPKIIAMVDFQPGNTYAEFDPKIDKVAEYGLATLIAGGALAGAAKLGLFAALFKWIVVAILALKKALFVVVIAFVAGVKKLWASLTGRSKTPDHLLPPPGAGGPPR
jgi:uncharacterized membrane-anchored protein